MTLSNKWEFPGGKIEPDETAEESLIREIKEELDVTIKINDSLSPNIHLYGTKAICLIPFICQITDGQISLKEHQSYQWLNSNELLALDWAAADLPIVKALLTIYDDI